MRVVAAIGLVGLLAAGCGSGQTSPGRSAMELTSSAFSDGGAIPSRHSCDGEDVSPPLEWDHVPDGTVGFALIADDPDARGFVHWVLSEIPGDATGLPDGQGDEIGVPGRNDFGRTGWAGPCPPSGEHRYVFALYALSEPLDIPGTPDAAAVRGALQDRVLAEARLTGIYARGG